MLSSIPKPVLFGGVLAAVIAVVLFLRTGGTRKTEMQLAQEAVADRDFGTAIQLFEQHIARHPDSAEAHLLAARAARRGGQDEVAEQHLAAYEKAGGDRQSIELEREMRRSQNGDVSNSHSVMNFVKENPDSPFATAMMEALAQGLMTARQPQPAIKAIDLLLAREASPADRAEWLCWRGEMLMGIARGTEAAIDLRAAIALREDHARARLAIITYLSREEPVEAMSHLEWLERHGHREPAVRLELARCQRHLGELSAAAAVIDELLAARPDDAAVLTEAGAIDMARGRLPDAERHLRKAIKLKPNGYEQTSMLARCLQELGRETEAAEWLEKTKKIEADIQRRLEGQKGKS
ncbi:tetratricopeptide repeat protein [Zavarzinella formosa]|uniref:tetratricopeptide repeat protein n=1 Tax=Zavarzinella formosa TaxID=360055 RepID=UPI000316A695|nr:tetratricopeptide repeat protein [Zavarzinella formosa]